MQLKCTESLLDFRMTHSSLRVLAMLEGIELSLAQGLTRETRIAAADAAT